MPIIWIFGHLSHFLMHPLGRAHEHHTPECLHVHNSLYMTLNLFVYDFKLECFIEYKILGHLFIAFIVLWHKMLLLRSLVSLYFLSLMRAWSFCFDVQRSFFPFKFDRFTKLCLVLATVDWFSRVFICPLNI